MLLTIGSAASAQDMADVFDKPMCQPLMPMNGTMEAMMPTDEPQPFRMAGMYLDRLGLVDAGLFVLPAVAALLIWQFISAEETGIARATAVVASIAEIGLFAMHVQYLSKAGRWIGSVVIDDDNGTPAKESGGMGE